MKAAARVDPWSDRAPPLEWLVMGSLARPTQSPPPIPSAPVPVFNCRQCSRFLPEGTLACPDCGALVYVQHVAALAGAAQELERERRWPEARAAWLAVKEWLPAESKETGTVDQRIAAVDSHDEAEKAKSARWVKRLGPLAPVLVLLSKLKGALFLLFKLKFLLSFVAFFGLYWALFGWKFGLGFTLSILVHEMGHYWEVKRRGLKVDLPVFLPGLGAYVRWYTMGVKLPVLASIALAGPLFGLVAALACLGLFYGTRQPVFLALAHTGAFINLLNLIPVLGLDGAQAMYALNKLQRGLLLLATLVLFGVMHQGVLLFLAAGLGWRMFTRDEPADASTGTMVYFLLLLFALAAFLRIVPPGTVNGAAGF